MKFEGKYFTDFNFTDEQIKKAIANAYRDLKIVREVEILDVKFNYAYTALIKSGIALCAFYRKKIKSAPGHHVKILEALADILKDKSVEDMGNVMRSKRNIDLYDGGICVTKKECEEYTNFVAGILEKVKKHIG